MNAAAAQSTQCSLSLATTAFELFTVEHNSLSGGIASNHESAGAARCVRKRAPLDHSRSPRREPGLRTALHAWAGRRPACCTLNVSATFGCDWQLRRGFPTLPLDPVVRVTSPSDRQLRHGEL